MARDHRKLRVFHDADALALAIYKNSKGFPRDEWFGLRAQLRRAAVSEVDYLLSVSARLGYISADVTAELKMLSDKVTAELQALLNGMELRIQERLGSGGRV